MPYQGSKNKIAEWVVEHLPSAPHLYDLFAGGGAVTHAALLSGKFEHVHANDVTDSVTLFEDALNGNLDKYEPDRFRSREDFFAEKDANPFVRLVYSFGSNQIDYLYGKYLEPYKKAVHEMIYAPTPNERRLKFMAVVRELERLLPAATTTTPKKIITHQSEEARMRISRIKARSQALERTEKMRRGKIQDMGKLHTSLKDYREVEILPDGVIYCDIPYRGTEKYRNITFDYEAFYDWCRRQTVLTVISEYSMPDDFICVAEKERTSSYSATNKSLRRVEKLFVPKHLHGLYEKSMNS